MINFIVSLVAALAAGIAIALIHMFRNHYTKSFILTLVLLPSTVCAIIMMVNGNLGVGVAVAGAFSLVRFRSAPGTAKEIGSLFIAMATGLFMGMGYLAYGFIFVAIELLVMFALMLTPFGEPKEEKGKKHIKVTIPEDLDYTEVFEDLFAKYTKKHTLISVKTSNMGSMFKLEYEVDLKEAEKEKELIDEIRVRNGNLEVACLRPVYNQGEL